VVRSWLSRVSLVIALILCLLNFDRLSPDIRQRVAKTLRVLFKNKPRFAWLVLSVVHSLRMLVRRKRGERAILLAL
jgi:hypothetical protein